MSKNSNRFIMSKNSKIRARGKYILVEVDSDETRVSKHGIVTPTNVEQEKKSIGTVLSVGDQIKDIKKGDRVIFGTYAGDSVKMEDSEYKLLHDDDILAFLEK